MKNIAFSLRFMFLLLAVIVTAVGLAPSGAEAAKSCEFYCGPPGPSNCYVVVGMNCPSWGID
jgi:hypothetical protein